MRSTWSILVLVAACGGTQPAAQAPAPTTELSEPSAATLANADPAVAPRSSPPVSNRSLAAVGLDPSALDRSVDPCDDFYQFSCGGWTQHTEIPADQPLAMRGFIDIAARNLEYMHGLLDRAAKAPGNDPALKQLGTFYRSCMDEDEIEKTGLGALRPLLSTIDRVKDPRSLSTALAALHAAGVPALFDLYPSQDAHDARVVIARLNQAGLGLPDRDYYLQPDENYSSARSAYLTYAESVLAALGHKDAHNEAAAVLGLETQIATLSQDKAGQRDLQNTYNKLDRQTLATVLGHLDWTAFWTGVGLPRIKTINVSSRAMFEAMNALIPTVKPETWRAYLAVQLVNATSDQLPRSIAELGFQLSSALTGQPELPPRWKRCVGFTEGALRDLVGQAFLRDRLGPAARAASEDQVRAIVDAMTRNLDALDWMDDTTRGEAKAKLTAMTYQVGAPRKWLSYPFKLDAHGWLANAVAARKAERARQLAKIDRPFDRDDWRMSVTHADAYYDPRLNGMVFPAGVLQPPIYSAESAIPVNFGALGSLIGHELTHGFDNLGAQYDAGGNLRDWWQPQTAAAFKQRTQCVVDQYSKYDNAGIMVDGATTSGENIADIGGVKLAFAAYQSLRGGAAEAQLADGFTEDQQFFLGFGQAWCAKLRPDFERMRMTTDDHAPPRWRVNGSVSATPEFRRAFRCAAGAKMAPAQQCVVW